MAQRLDKWLVYARFVKHRALAADLIVSGQVRLNRERVAKSSHVVKPDDVLTINIGGQIKVVKVLGEAVRRGPASEASLLYLQLNTAEKAGASEAALS